MQEIDEEDDPTSSASEYFTPPEIREAADATRQNLIPEKSRKKYEGEYGVYKTWQTAKNLKHTSENVLLAYFGELAKIKAPSTLWAIYSMLKSTLDVNENVKISEYTKLTSFLKYQHKGFQSKKSQVFTAAQISFWRRHRTKFI